jgi:hypothetical protein
MEHPSFSKTFLAFFQVLAEIAQFLLFELSKWTFSLQLDCADRSHLAQYLLIH